MKRNQVKHSYIFQMLCERGVGKRKALRMIKHAIFVNKKGGCFVIDSAPASFCIWADQGKYRSTWMEAGYAK